MNLLNIDKIRQYKYDMSEVLEIKSYLPLAAKQILLKNILDLCKKEENDIIKIDYTLKEFAIEISLVNQYSNVDLQVDDVVEVYDELKQNGIIANIINQIPEEEINFIDYVLEKEITQIQAVDNSIEMVLAKTLNKIVNKLPDEKGMTKIVKSLPKEINKIDPAKLQYITKAIGWNTGVNKN